MTDLTCPNCGDNVAPLIANVRVMDCPSCGTSLFLEDGVFRRAGEAGEMHDSPALFGLGDTVEIGGAQIEVHGHVRYSYGRGWWDEYWGVYGGGNEAWISVDEGDVTVQTKVPRPRQPRGDLSVGRKLTLDDTGFTVTELGTAECIARRGSFSERLTVGETYRFVDATAADGTLLSGEIWPGGEAWFAGLWYDAFEVVVLPR